jgi:hypothetical protein
MPGDSHITYALPRRIGARHAGAQAVIASGSVLNFTDRKVIDHFHKFMSAGRQHQAVTGLLFTTHIAHGSGDSET